MRRRLELFALAFVASATLVTCGGGSSSPDGGGTAGVSCDPQKILCKRVAPVCPTGQVPSVEGSCYGPCVPPATCTCATSAECPSPAENTCLASGRCG